MNLSIGYVTGRMMPRLDWVIDGLAAQAQPGDEIQLVVVDYFDRPAEELGYRPIPCIADLVELAPKPTPWQGRHSVTPCDWWAMSNARNTALVHMDADYIAFLDDRCALGPQWLETVRRGHRERASVLAGAYVKAGPDLDADARWDSRDGRLEAAPRGMVDCGPGWLFGCTFAMPLAWALEVNGFEEGCDGMGGEDGIFGLMLTARGRRIDYVPELFVSQDRSTAANHHFHRRSKADASPRWTAALERFGTRNRTEFTPDLTVLRDGRRATGVAAWPRINPQDVHRDWYDGRRLAGLGAAT